MSLWAATNVRSISNARASAVWAPSQFPFFKWARPSNRHAPASSGRSAVRLSSDAIIAGETPEICAVATPGITTIKDHVNANILHKIEDALWTDVQSER